MSLSAEQLTDLRADLGDQLSPYAFSDAELDRLYERNDSDWNSTLIMAIEQLLQNSAKLYNYTAGYTRQDEGQVFDHLLKMRDVFLGKENNALFVRVSPKRRKGHRHARHFHMDD